nr:MAG TPA: Helix-turn-helix XRE-family like protein [Caudoviricetes sp.]
MDKSPIVIRINSLLAKKGITKAEFYEKCALTSASYSQWNTGKTKPRLQTIERIAEFLRVPSEYLLYGDAPAASQGAKKAPDPEIEGGREAVSNFISATNDRAALLAIINEATKKLQEME